MIRPRTGYQQTGRSGNYWNVIKRETRQVLRARRQVHAHATCEPTAKICARGARSRRTNVSKCHAMLARVFLLTATRQNDLRFRYFQIITCKQDSTRHTHIHIFALYTSGLLAIHQLIICPVLLFFTNCQVAYDWMQWLYFKKKLFCVS